MYVFWGLILHSSIYVLWEITNIWLLAGIYNFCIKNYWYSLILARLMFVYLEKLAW